MQISTGRGDQIVFGASSDLAEITRMAGLANIIKFYDEACTREIASYYQSILSQPQAQTEQLPVVARLSIINEPILFLSKHQRIL